VRVAVVNSMTAGRRRYSRCGLRYLSTWQRSEAVGGPPRREVRISGCPGIEMGVFVEASMNQRDRRVFMCSLRVTVPW
jgi:hypothetical protein